jgi:site-specific DNA-methyltransferase (adenine-specific)
MINLLNGNNLDLLKDLEDNSVDSVVTDPPYGISFMNKKWDYDVPSVNFWKECYRVLKPGGHIIVACGTRTQHRMAVNIEDSGFELRDILVWAYATGFPKSMNVGKTMDQFLGNEREVIGQDINILTKQASDFKKGKRKIVDSFDLGAPTRNNGFKTLSADITKGTSEWEGWGTSLKPAVELWTLARKPISEKNITENVLKWGTGAINIDGCRVPYGNEQELEELNQGRKSNRTKREGDVAKGFGMKPQGLKDTIQPEGGRFPANLILDGSDEVNDLFPNSNGAGGSQPKVKVTGYGSNIGGGKSEYNPDGRIPMDSGSGSASRFFFCAKPSPKERNFGLGDEFEIRRPGERTSTGMGTFEVKGVQPQKNFHPTIKPITLMCYLSKLITPKNGICLDPFMGSGSTGIACVINGFNFIGMEMEKDYFNIAKARIDYSINNITEAKSLVKETKTSIKEDVVNLDNDNLF